CQQDAPAMATGVGRSACARCGNNLDDADERLGGRGAAVDFGLDLECPAPSPSAECACFLEDDWLLHQDLKRLRQRVTSLSTSSSASIGSGEKHPAGTSSEPTAVPREPSRLPA